MIVRALVVDDEEPARRRLMRMLSAVPDVAVVGEAEDGAQTLERVRALAPDVVFLDVRMPGIDGVTLAQTFVDLPPIIFVTAHDEHAVAAFDLEAVDYLLKPVRPERLAKAIERVRQRPSDPQAVQRALAKVAPPTSRIVSSARGVTRFYDAAEITRFWSADKYTLFRIAGDEHLTEEPLTKLAHRLASFGFVRIHRSELVRLAAITGLHSDSGIHEVELADAQRVRVSRRSLADLRAALGLTRR